MTTRREVFPLLAGAAGVSAASASHAAAAAAVGARAQARFLPERAHRQAARLLRLSSARIRASEALAGDAVPARRRRTRRRPGRARLRAHPRTAVRSVVPAPRPALRDHLAAARQVQPRRGSIHQGPHPGPDTAAARKLDQPAARRRPACDCRSPCRASSRTTSCRMDPRGRPMAGTKWRSELVAMVDRTIADFKGDAKRVYLTGPELRRLWCVESRGASSGQVRRARTHRRLRPSRSRGADRARQTTVVGVRGRTRSGRAAALLLSGAQQARGARPSRGSLHRRGRPGSPDLGAHLRRPGSVFLAAGPIALTPRKKGRQLALPPRSFAERLRQNEPLIPSRIWRPGANEARGV